MAELLNFENIRVRFGQSIVQLVFVKYLENGKRYKKNCKRAKLFRIKSGCGTLKSTKTLKGREQAKKQHNLFFSSLYFDLSQAYFELRGKLVGLAMVRPLVDISRN